MTTHLHCNVSSFTIYLLKDKFTGRSDCRSCKRMLDDKYIVKVKGKFLYSAVSSPQDRSKRFTLYFPDRPVHSDTISASLGSIQPYAAINA